MNSERTRREAPTATVPWAVRGFGWLSVALFIAWCLWFRPTLDVAAVLVGFATVAVPAFGLVWGGRRLERSEIGADRYARIAQWCFGTGIGFLAVNGLVIVLFPWYTVAGNLVWAQFSITTGAVAGFAVGYVEARAIEREVEATAAAVRAERLEAERELLTYLNDLLRHEVLNSAQIVGGHASLAREDADGETRDHLETIERQSEALTNVIEDVRAMLDANREADLGAAVDVGEVLTDELAALERRFDGTEIDVDATVPASVSVRGNEGIGWIFANVLENAVEHNDGERPRLEVTVETTTDAVAVRIADDGPGIPPETRETLFERKSDHHGLGLYLVHILAKRYGGRVELTETGPDGSVFTVWLSRASAADVADPPSGTPTGEDSTGDRATDADRVESGEATDAETDQHRSADANDSAIGPS